MRSLTPRFDHAISQLYKAFHSNQLNPECHSQCAVGNICKNSTAWQYLTDHHGSGKLSYVGLIHQRLGRKFYGFQPIELLEIEQTFLKGCGYKTPLAHYKKKEKNNKDDLFNGLTEVISYLCQLERIDNIMDCSQIFNYKINHTPEKELSILEKL